MSFEVQGKIEELYEAQQITDRFKKREFVLEVQSGMYPEYVKFQLTQDRCGLIDSYQKGDEITVSFNLKGRPYTKDGKTTYFTNLEAWRIEGGSTAAPSSNASSTSKPKQSEAAAPSKNDDVLGMSFSEAGDDELPF